MTAGAVVVGGASGIGAEVVALYRAEGTPVVVWDIQDPCDIHCDVADPADVERATEETVARWDVPRWVTITAGVGHAGLLSDADPEEWDRVMRVNARGPWLCMRSLARVMTHADQPGSIVVTSSVSAHLVDRNMGVYCASKAALNMLVKVAAAEWGARSIRVNAVAPGVTMTPMLGGIPEGSAWLTGVVERTALERLGHPVDIAHAIRAVHDLEWVTGQIVECDGGLSLYSPIDAYGEGIRARRGRGS
ncbi:MAG TPA: SDR family oxidoreductase [Acidimicrobiales bacterium]|nr:SDR family oxidoreductase [Acidimicrobiales bacterium]